MTAEGNGKPDPRGSPAGRLSPTLASSFRPTSTSASASPYRLQPANQRAIAATLTLTKPQGREDGRAGRGGKGDMHIHQRYTHTHTHRHTQTRDPHGASGREGEALQASKELGGEGGTGAGRLLPAICQQGQKVPGPAVLVHLQPLAPQDARDEKDTAAPDPGLAARRQFLFGCG